MPAASSDCRGTLPAGRAEPKDRDEELGELLLNSKVTTSDPAPPKRRNGDIGSLWFDIRGHLHRFDLKFEMAPAVEEMGTPAKRLQLRVPHHNAWLDHRTVLRHVKLHLKNKHWNRWAAMKDQGKGARVFRDAGSAFLTRPGGLWETDYRFAVAGRLNQLDTHSVLKRRRLHAHDKCRHPGCSRLETLAHVLNHCAGSMNAVRTRHDDALKTIERKIAASTSVEGDRVELRVNQTVPSMPGPALRPGLQIYNHTKRTVPTVDLAVAFEEQVVDDPQMWSLARITEVKRRKYDCIKRYLERYGWAVQLSALVYRSLVAVAGGNLVISPITSDCSSAMQGGWNGNYLSTALRPAVAFGICIVACTATVSVQVVQDQLLGAVELTEAGR